MPIGSLDVWPVSIDGLLPGEHKIVIGFIWTEGSNRVAGEDPKEMLFTAEVGHLYLTKAYMPKKLAEGQVRVSFWIEDANTGEVVAGTRPATAR